MLTGRTAEAEALLGLPAPLPLPIYISLGDYNRYCLDPKLANDPEHGTIWGYARHMLIRELSALRLPSDFFERVLTRGQACVFLLDGLDEVVEERHRQNVIKSLTRHPVMVKTLPAFEILAKRALGILRYKSLQCGIKDREIRAHKPPPN